MMRDKPVLDRRQVLVSEGAKRRCERTLRQILGELGRDEYLGTPVRRSGVILIPIKKRSAENRGSGTPRLMPRDCFQG